MAKGGGNIGERAAAGCIGGIIRLMFILGCIAALIMVFAYMFGAVGGIDFLDIFDTSTPIYKEARSLGKGQEYEKSIKKYAEFFKSAEATEENKDKVIQAHMDCALMLQSLAQDLSLNDPKYEEKHNLYYREAIAHCDKVLAINKKHRRAEEIKAILMFQQG